MVCSKGEVACKSTGMKAWQITSAAVYMVATVRPE